MHSPCALSVLVFASTASKGVTRMLDIAGLAFSEVERDRLYLRGLLPPAILSQTVQAERVMINIRAKASDMDRHSYLTSLQVHVLCVVWRMLSLIGCMQSNASPYN